jgi:uncharacterized membrane protein YdfJ with MMPL/SSD domain
VIFAAGAVVIAVFFTFAPSEPLPPKEMGIILGIAVLLDAAPLPTPQAPPATHPHAPAPLREPPRHPQ